MSEPRMPHDEVVPGWVNGCLYCCPGIYRIMHDSRVIHWDNRYPQSMGYSCPTFIVVTP